ncbi:hypothetical protein [Microbacterium testaceum]|uniref:hypothetical protein n=1 Tax=Microbacterium testaceum TaxID=2033 RepID=UPI0016522513|nr:hypothetical protein [Microbacterium testaceum]
MASVPGAKRRVNQNEPWGGMFWLFETSYTRGSDAASSGSNVVDPLTSSQAIPDVG